MKKTRIKEGSRERSSPPPPQRKFISFFSGALGLDQGLEAAGLRCLAVNDVDRVAAETIRTNRPDLKLYDCDIREISPNLIQKDIGIKTGELFAIVGGPPCQAFSTAGRRLGLNDERGNVFLHFIELIRSLRPKYAIFENVRGLLSAPLSHRPHDQRGPRFKPSKLERPGGALLYILGKLEQAGYVTTFNLYNTANFGIPQVRERLIFFASREDREVPFMKPTHNETGSSGFLKWRSLQDAIGHLQGKPMHAAKFPENRVQYYKLLKSGQNWRDLPDKVQKAAMGNSWFAGGGKTGFYRRLAWHKPSPTLVTRPTMKATDLCHPDELRPLSVEEYAAIQTFPSNFRFAGNLDNQYRQIGNAVPCVFGHAIGRHIIEVDDGKTQNTVVQTKFSRYVGTDHESWRESIGASERQLSLLAD